MPSGRCNPHLKQNDFEPNISNALRELREEKDFFDVTLACDDSQIQAHKVILSACSSFFRNVLRDEKWGSVYLCPELSSTDGEEVFLCLTLMHLVPLAKRNQ